MGWAKIRGQLPSRIGQRVRFGAPQDVQRAGGEHGTGVIVDEVWADAEINTSPSRPSKGTGDWGDYSFFAQRIKWHGGGHLIRLGYYRRRAGEDFWEFAGQTTICARWRAVKSLLDGFSTKPNWFADEDKPSP
jgi:hypothetical protein